MATNSFTVKEGMTLAVPFSVNTNPQPDSYVLYFQDVNVADIYTNSTIIRISNISRSQAGGYSLKISNKISTACFNFTVDVTCELWAIDQLSFNSCCVY